MNLSVIFQPGAVKASQQRMIQWIEYKDIKRRALAEMIHVDPSYVHHVMSDSTNKRFTTEQDRALHYIASALDNDEPIEELIAGRKCVAPIPDVPFNGCTDDEVLDGAQAIGQTRFDALRGDWRAVIAYGWQLIAVGWRLVVHGKKMLGQEVPKVGTQSVPLFDMVSA